MSVTSISYSFTNKVNTNLKTRLHDKQESQARFHCTIGHMHNETPGTPHAVSKIKSKKKLKPKLNQVCYYHKKLGNFNDKFYKMENIKGHTKQNL